jgi:hypothetical protein
VKRRVHSLAAALLIAPSIAFARSGDFAGPTVVGIPVEFILFAIVLLGVALFHRHTFPIAAGGALVIALYKIFCAMGGPSPWRT